MKCCSTEIVIRIRQKVSAGGVADISIEGDAAADNAKILNVLRVLWQSGHAAFGWPPLGVDQDKTVPAPQRRRYRKKK